MTSLFSDPVQALVAINVLLTLSLLFPFAAGVWSLNVQRSHRIANRLRAGR